MEISDLSAWKLGRDEIYNVGCNHLASEEWKLGFHPVEDPNITPAEWWALYSRYPYYHKITEELSNGIYSTLGYHQLLKYISKKHGITSSNCQRQLFSSDTITTREAALFATQIWVALCWHIRWLEPATRFYRTEGRGYTISWQAIPHATNT